jgi:predicted Zn-dependent protease with MMP-like domain
MELNESQANELRVKFAEYIVDTMDMKCLLQFAFDSIIENLPINAEDLITEIRDNYDQETLDDLLSAID